MVLSLLLLTITTNPW